MSYRSLNIKDAKSVYQVRLENGFLNWSELGSERERGTLSYDRLIQDLNVVRSQFELPLSGGRAAAFEVEVGIVLHQHIEDKKAVEDMGFWRWLSLGPLNELVIDRHASDRGDMPKEANYGIGSEVECFLYRAWLRAEIGSDRRAPSEERYRLARRGDQDFWRSFIFRTRLAFYRNVAQALVEFQYPTDDSAGVLVKGDKDDGIRMLAKRLNRIQPNIALGFLSRDEAKQLICELANGLTRAEPESNL